MLRDQPAASAFVQDGDAANVEVFAISVERKGMGAAEDVGEAGSGIVGAVVRDH